MFEALAALLKALLSFFFSVGAKPAGLQEAEDAPNQKEINDDIDKLPPHPYR